MLITESRGAAEKGLFQFPDHRLPLGPIRSAQRIQGARCGGSETGLINY